MLISSRDVPMYLKPVSQGGGQWQAQKSKRAGGQLQTDIQIEGRTWSEIRKGGVNDCFPLPLYSYL